MSYKLQCEHLALWESIGNCFYITRMQKFVKIWFLSKIGKFENFCLSILKDRNFPKLTEYEVPKSWLRSKGFQKIFSSLRIRTRLVFDQNSNPSLSSEVYKNDSLCLDTLYHKCWTNCTSSIYLKRLLLVFNHFLIINQENISS